MAGRSEFSEIPAAPAGPGFTLGGWGGPWPARARQHISPTLDVTEKGGRNRPNTGAEQFYFFRMSAGRAPKKGERPKRGQGSLFDECF